MSPLGYAPMFLPLVQMVTEICLVPWWGAETGRTKQERTTESDACWLEGSSCFLGWYELLCVSDEQHSWHMLALKKC